LRRGLLGTFGAYCESYSVWRSAVEALARIAADDPLMRGLLIRRDGEAIPNPLVRIARQAADSMLCAAREFGLTASARARLAAGPSERPDDEFSGLLA
jgi:P27 family predicted phage terminase small subunit